LIARVAGVSPKQGSTLFISPLQIFFLASSMPPGQKSRGEKVVQTIEYIKKCCWRSTSQFVEVFYHFEAGEVGKAVVGH